MLIMQTDRGSGKERQQKKEKEICIKEITITKCQADRDRHTWHESESELVRSEESGLTL